MTETASDHILHRWLPLWSCFWQFPDL